MEGKMKAFGITEQFKGFGPLVADIPQITPLDVLCEPVALAACTSDPHQVHAGLPVGLVLGHEVCGRVVEVGSLVKRFKVGDVVAVGCTTADYLAPEVQDSLPQHSNGLFGGMNWCTVENGTFAQYFRIRQADANATFIPEGLTPAHAVMAADMCTTGFHGVELADVQFGDTVVVCGIGPVGLMAVAGAALRGAGRIVALGNRPVTMDLAKEYGATDVLNYKDGPVDQQVMDLLGGYADSVIIAGGGEKTFIECANTVRPAGHVANIVAGTFATNIPYATTAGWCNHKIFTGGLCPGGRRRLERLFNLMLAGRLDPTKMITHEFHGFDHIQDAYELMANKSEHPDLIKPIVYMD